MNINFKYIYIINIFLSFLFIYLVFNTGMSFISVNLNKSKKYTVNRVFTSKDNSNEKQFSYYKVIIDRNFFMPLITEEIKPPVKPAVMVTPPPRIPEIIPEKPAPPPKPLNLKLKGTVVGISENSFAIIENTARRVDEFYMVNDIIKDTDAKIIDISRNVVTLKIGDRIEYLTIYEEDKKTIQQKPEKTFTSKPASPYIQPASSSGAEKSFVVNRTEVVGSMGGDIDQIIEKVMTSININPYIENGKFMGYSITNLESLGDLLTGQGFENGDIVKEVNGIKLESPEKLFELYQALYPQLESLSSINVVLSRSGADKTLNYSIK
ncbi:hypothetical protein HY745_07705 [Candidatus Desantisbacteria bacterium]|nr:hypothetical protein [Candidatus Desantisbacteria bacterium]